MTLFNADDKNVQPIVEDIPADGTSAYDALVGEGKKYKDNEMLAKSRLEADLHIARLEREAADRRQAEAQQATIKDILDKLDARTSSSNVQPDDDGEGTSREPANKAVTEEAIRNMVKQLASEERSNATKQQNLETTIQELHKAFGPTWQQRLVQKRSELGLTEEFMNDIASKSPKALLNLVGATASTTTVPNTHLAPRSQVANAPVDDIGGVKNEKYWEALYKKNPDEYKQRTLERHRAATKLGRAYFD